MIRCTTQLVKYNIPYIIKILYLLHNWFYFILPCVMYVLYLIYIMYVIYTMYTVYVL